MISAVILWLFVSLALFFLYLGWTKKQFMMIIIAGLFFLLCVVAVGDGIIIDKSINSTTETCNCTESREGALVKSLNYTYQYELLSNFMKNTLITFFLILTFICIIFGIVMSWLNPNMDDKSKENGGREFWDDYNNDRD